MITRVVVILMALVAARIAEALPKQAGYPFEGHTGFRVSAMTERLKAGSFSVAAWVNVADPARSQIFMTMGQSNQDFSFYLYNGAVRLLIEGSVGSYGFAAAKPPKPAAWTHYLGTYDGQHIAIYRDGVLEGEKSVALKRTAFAHALTVGMIADDEARILKGNMTDIRIWNRVLDAREARQLAADETWPEQDRELIARWLTHPTDTTIANRVKGAPELVKGQPVLATLLNRTMDGFRGIWYFNQPSKDEYVYKYSGGLGTYCAKHIPFAWYAPEVNKTFFCYGGTDAKNSTLLHMVSYYDHASGLVARPTILLDKKTDDAHDNPVINIDDKGYIWIFSSSHGRGRPSYISRSIKPYDIAAFQVMWTGNFSYPQPIYYPGKGFLFIHTWYVKGRGNYIMTSNPEGTVWSERRQTAYFGEGHYQISGTWKSRKTGVAFDQHPKGKGLNWRTNLYYMESDDFGQTWKNAQGEVLELPLTNSLNAAIVLNYENQGRNVYLKEVQFDEQGHPIILFILSKGYESGPANGPREWRIVRWDGSRWIERFTGICSGNNYDFGPLYVESETAWRIIGPTQLGPQPYNPGGEIALWTSNDRGETWTMTRQMTKNSVMNHTFVRRPVNARPDFYGFWADGHGRQPSTSSLYFCTREGDVFRLPAQMTGDFAKPEIVR